MKRAMPARSAAMRQLGGTPRSTPRKWWRRKSGNEDWFDHDRSSAANELFPGSQSWSAGAWRRGRLPGGPFGASENLPRSDFLAVHFYGGGRNPYIGQSAARLLDVVPAAALRLRPLLSPAGFLPQRDRAGLTARQDGLDLEFDPSARRDRLRWHGDVHHEI